jgi:hypothetical protein
MFNTDSTQRFHSGLVLRWFGSQSSDTRSRSALAQHGRFGLRKIDRVRTGANFDRKEHALSAETIVVSASFRSGVVTNDRTKAKFQSEEKQLWLFSRKQTKTIKIHTTRCGE